MWSTPRNSEPGGRLVRILEADPDLAADLDPQALESATAELTASVASIEWRQRRGRWGPSAPQGHLGLLMIRGLLLREVRLLGGSSAEVLGEGDLLRPWDVNAEYFMPVPGEVQWTVLMDCEVAVLHSQFVRRAARWPDVLARLTGRAKALSLHDALTNLKHVETRLLVQFWHLAERWGQVGPRSVSIPVPLTHDMLGKLVGATRPTVTTGLGNLASRGLLLREPGGLWQLSHDSREALTPLPIQPETRLAS
jgi:CRP/FNR family transcriptional regulator, cyclic AMP receptor protein